MKLIVFSGLPGTGKSTLAELTGRQLGVPVFAKDWLEAVLLQNGLHPTSDEKTLGYVGYELLTALAKRQLMLGQSVILDSVAGTKNIRETWKNVAQQYRYDWRVVECVCSNEVLHQEGLKGRKRNIPGWHELKWSDVEAVKRYYQSWDEGRLVLDMANSIEENISRIKSYCE